MCWARHAGSLRLCCDCGAPEGRPCRAAPRAAARLARRRSAGASALPLTGRRARVLLRGARPLVGGVTLVQPRARRGRLPAAGRAARARRRWRRGAGQRAQVFLIMAGRRAAPSRAAHLCAPCAHWLASSGSRCSSSAHSTNAWLVLWRFSFSSPLPSSSCLPPPPMWISSPSPASSLPVTLLLVAPAAPEAAYSESLSSSVLPPRSRSRRV